MTINELFYDLSMGYREQKRESLKSGVEPMSLETYLTKEDAVERLKKVLGIRV